MNENAIPGAPEEFVRVFVSYAREDKRWLDPDYRYSLIPFLMESLRRHRVAFWFDKELKPGDEFRRFIESEIDQSQIALLIVSQSFLNSEFIENREMPRIAERARLGKMIVVPVLVEPCDWSEYPFLADRQMVPSSPLIDYTESEPQWAKVRFQILDGLKAQLKRIREAPQSRAEKVQTSVPDEIPSSSAISEAAQTLEMPPATPETGNALVENAVPLRQEQEARASEPVLQPEAEPDVSRGFAREPDAAAAEPVPAPVDISNPVSASSQATPELGGIRETVKVPTLGMTTPSPESQEEWEEDQTQDSIVERKKTRIPRIWMIVIAGGAALVVLLVGLLIFKPRSAFKSVYTGGYTASLSSIFASSDGTLLWAVGWSGWSGTILVSPDGGATWEVRKDDITQALHSIFGTSDGKRLWAVGDYGTIIESDDGGASWTARNLRIRGTKEALDSIFGTSDGRLLWAVGEAGTIVESVDGGTSWAARSSGTTETLRSVSGAIDGTQLCAVGDSGTILQSGDGGATWISRGTLGLDLYSLFMTSDGQHLWAVGGFGTVRKSDNSGATWTDTFNLGSNDSFFSVFGSSDGKHLWVVGDKGTILESGDGGANWTARNSGTKIDLRSIFGTSDGQHLWAAGDHDTILESRR
jgi:photosystem II stability/assembly factor-like uncharacterized protein